MTCCRRALLLFGVVLLLVGTRLPLVAQTEGEVPSAPPNVVLILGDDQAWMDYGFMGSEVVETPHIDQLAAESACFVNGYVPTSLCRPSLATLITGLYPHQHKITGNDQPKGLPRSAMLKHIRSAPSLPRILGEHGYVSYQTGKWWEGNPTEGGFTAGMTNGDPTKGGRHGDKGLQIGREGLDPIWNFLDDRGEKPFLLWYAPFLPHQPHTPPQRLLKKYRQPGRPIEVAKYYAMCEWFDETCGELMAGLGDRGLTENTIVVFICDNGWIQRTSEMEVPEGWKKPFAPKSKQSPYDGGLRTPILVKWPGHITPKRYESLVSTVDVAPTVLNALGIKPPVALPGIDLQDVIANGGKTSRDGVYGATFDHDIPDIDDPSAGLTYRWCRQGDWKFILDAAGEHPELYNVADDPHETNNLAAEQEAKVGELTAALDKWWTP